MHINGELENVFIERVNSWTLPDFDPSESGRIWYFEENRMFVYNNGRSIVPLVDYQMFSTLGEQRIIAVDSVTFEYNIYEGYGADNDYYRQFWDENADTNPMTFTHTPTHWTFGKHLIIMNDHTLEDPSSYEFYIKLPKYRKQGEIGRPPLEMGSFRITNKSSNVINISSNMIGDLGGPDAVYTSSTKINPGTTALFQLFYDHFDMNDEDIGSTQWAVIFEETAASSGSGASVTPLRNLVEVSRRPEDDTDVAYAPRWKLAGGSYTPYDYEDSTARYLRFPVGGTYSDLPMLALGLSNIADRIDSQTHFATPVKFNTEDYHFKYWLRSNQQVLEFWFQIVLYDYASPQDSQLLHSTQLVKLVTTLPWTDYREEGDETPVVEPYEYAGTFDVNVVLPDGLDYADPVRYALLVAVSADTTTLVETGYPALTPGNDSHGDLELTTFFQERLIDPYSEKFEMPSVNDPD